MNGVNLQAERRAFDRHQLEEARREFEDFELASSGTFYRRIDASAIDPAKVQAVGWTLDAVAPALDLDPTDLTIAWLKSATGPQWLTARRNGHAADLVRLEGPIQGRSFGSRIELVLKQSVRELIITAAHEIRHVWQASAPEAADWSPERREADAREYAAGWRTFARFAALAVAAVAANSSINTVEENR